MNQKKAQEMNKIARGKNSVVLLAVGWQAHAQQTPEPGQPANGVPTPTHTCQQGVRVPGALHPVKIVKPTAFTFVELLLALCCVSLLLAALVVCHHRANGPETTKPTVTRNAAGEVTQLNSTNAAEVMKHYQEHRR
jgi:hypothetical protein